MKNKSLKYELRSSLALLEGALAMNDATKGTGYISRKTLKDAKKTARVNIILALQGIRRAEGLMAEYKQAEVMTKWASVIQGIAEVSALQYPQHAVELKKAGVKLAKSLKTKAA
jgi:hypothetical protein